MKITIGENLRRLRLNKELTQEQLAEFLGVSPQAVSRWENNSTYPDITLLPCIAVFYKTSIDELIGMEEICSAENINKIHHEVHTLMGKNKIDETITMLREALKLHPNSFLLDLASTLTQKSNQSNDVSLIREAISLFERALQGNLIMKSRSTATANLIFLYLKSGESDRAEDLVKSLPHIWESREIIMPEVFDGDEYVDELKTSIIKTLMLLCEKVKSVPKRQYAEIPSYIQSGLAFAATESIDEMLDLIQAFFRVTSKRSTLSE